MVGGVGGSEVTPPQRVQAASKQGMGAWEKTPCRKSLLTKWHKQGFQIQD